MIFRALLLCLAFVCLAGCPGSRAHRAAVQEQAHEKKVARKHIAPALRPISDDLDRQLARAAGVGIGASALSVAGMVFVAFEASAFLRIALAIAAACIGSTVAIFAIRLSVPLLAIALPWCLGVGVLAAIAAGWLWYRHPCPVRLCKLLPGRAKPQ